MHKYNPPVDFEPLAGWLCHRRLPSRLRFPWNLQRVSRTMFIKTAKAILGVASRHYYTADRHGGVKTTHVVFINVKIKYK